MSTRWHIKAGDVHGTHNKTHLIGCSLARDSHTDQYLFMGPDPNGLPLAAVDITVDLQFPFVFRKFTSPLNGSDSLDWYIQVNYVDGPNGEAGGYWSNSPFQAPPGDGRPPQPGDPDTWTTQAGVGPPPEPEENKEDKKKAAGSASSK